MPATPAAPGQRRRRNAGQSEWRKLPTAPPKKKAPALPKRDGGWLPSTVKWWKAVWESPMANAWLDTDTENLLRLATMRDAVGHNPTIAGLHAQITALEDRLGLSPKARRALQWEIDRDNAAAEKNEQPPAQVRRLRAV